MKRNENSFGTQSLSLSFSRKSEVEFDRLRRGEIFSNCVHLALTSGWEKNGGSGISYSATLLESKEFWQQVEEKEGLERGDGSRANEFSNFVSSRLSSITTRSGIFGAISPLSLSRAIEKDGKGSKVALVPPLMELHRWWLYTDTKPVALPARGNPMPRNRSSPSLFPGRSIRFKKKKIGILASI